MRKSRPNLSTASSAKRAINDEGKVAEGSQESNTQARWKHSGSAT